MKLLVTTLALLAGLAQAQRANVKAHDTSHLDKLDRDELLNILGEIENSAPSKSTSAPYRPPSSYSTYSPVTAPSAPPRRKVTTTYRPFYSPTTRRSSSDIDDLINKYKNKKPGAPTVDDLLRRLRTNNPSVPVSTYSFPGPNYAAPKASNPSALPYPTSYDSRLFPSKPAAYPSASLNPSAPSYPSSIYPALPTYPKAPSYSSGSLSSNNSPYNPTATYGGYVPKYAASATTRKPKKNFLTKLFG